MEGLVIKVGLDDLDEGYFAEQAIRVLQGQIPYRDFDSLYTPGLLYVHAAAFAALGGPHIVALRLIALAGRAAMAFGLYALGRPLMRPGWAAVAPVFILIGLDDAPDRWEPHPGWLSTCGTLAAVWALARWRSARPARRGWWLLASGAATAVTFLFKQNTGALVGLAQVTFVLLQASDGCRARAVTELRYLQLTVATGVMGAAVWLLRANRDVVADAYLLAPLAGILLLSLRRPIIREGRTLHGALAPVAALGAGFGIVTTLWLVPLLLALGGDMRRLGALAGAVDSTALFYPPDLPTGNVWPVLVLSAGLVTAAGGGRWRWGGVASCTAALLALPAVTRVPGDLPWVTLLAAPARSATGLATLLPTAASLAGLWLSRRPPGSFAEWRVRWYLTAGTLVFLVQYPRLDVIHLAWSAPLLLVLGALALDRLHVWLGARWQRTRAGGALLLAGLLVAPMFATLPVAYWRAGALFTTDGVRGLPTPVPLVALADVPWADGVMVPAATRDDLVGVLNELKARTKPGQAIVVYPSSPLLYVLAERPNPTRYAHLYPGATDAAGLREAIAAIRERRVHIVVVSDFWLAAWGPGEGGNHPLDEFLAAHFHDVARSGAYRVLAGDGSEP